MDIKENNPHLEEGNLENNPTPEMPEPLSNEEAEKKEGESLKWRQERKEINDLKKGLHEKVRREMGSGKALEDKGEVDKLLRIAEGGAIIPAVNAAKKENNPHRLDVFHDKLVEKTNKKRSR